MKYPGILQKKADDKSAIWSGLRESNSPGLLVSAALVLRTSKAGAQPMGQIRIVPHENGGEPRNRTACCQRRQIYSLLGLPNPSLSENWWTLPGSNRPPPACKASALPNELKAQVQRCNTSKLAEREGFYPLRPGGLRFENACLLVLNWSE